MADDVDTDPIIDEIDVFLSKSLAQNLFLMQYPLRPVGLGYGHFENLSARVKPQQKRVEMELALDTRSKNYSTSKGEQISVNVDGNLPPNSADKVFSGSKMDKIVLSCPPSTKSFTNCQYAVGLFKDGELHLTPVNAVVQMRPCFDYLDKADKRHHAEAANMNVTDGGESAQDDDADEAVPVNMKVSRGESEEFKARRMASYEYVSQKREDEYWVDVTYHTAESGISEAERQHLHAGDAAHVSHFKITPQEYLQALIPPSSEDKSEKPAMPDNVLSLTELRKLELNEQIRALLMNVKVMRFSQLMSFVAPGTDQQAVLKSLQSMAVLVQGCWVIKRCYTGIGHKVGEYMGNVEKWEQRDGTHLGKINVQADTTSATSSELVYPDEDKGETTKKRKFHSTVSPELMRRVRDYAMWKFTHNKHVVRKDISSIVQLPSDDVKEILEKMSRLKARTGWEFLYDYDRDFCERHPEIVQRQRNKWALTFHTLAQHFKLPKDGDKKALESEIALMNQQPTERHRSRRLSSRSPRKRTLSGRSQSDVSDVELDLAEKHKILENPTCRNILDMDVTFNGNGHPSALPQNGLSLSHIGKMHAPYASSGQNSCDNSVLMSELEKFVREVLAESSTLCMSDLRSKLSLYTARVPSAHVFTAGVSDKMIEDAVVAIGGFRLKNQWPPNRKPEPMFSSLTGDKEVDQLRKLLFSMFEESPKLRSASFRSRANVAGIDLSEAEMKKFLKDHCDVVGAVWYLKRTLPLKS